MDAVSKFVVSNPLHPDVFPGKLNHTDARSEKFSIDQDYVGVRKMEAEVVKMCLTL